MQREGQATRISLFDFHSPPMRAFHVTWLAFFSCFFAWFAIAPLMPIVRDEFGLTKQQVGWTMIASVAATIFARLAIGRICDRVGPRVAYKWLLILGSIPVMTIGFAQSFETFLIFRLMIGVIGASFVVTQYHTSLMFTPNCIGTANATTAGLGNLGGGITQVVTPLVCTLFVGALSLEPYWGWRLSMFVAGAVCMVFGFLYARLTQDTPEGNFADLRAAGKLESKAKTKGTFLMACRDYRTWLLFVLYGACFGMELTIKNIAALYFTDYFSLGLQMAGLAASAYGAMNLFARPLGGYVSDRCSARWGLMGRTRWLFVALIGEGLALMLFAQASGIFVAVTALMLVGLFVQMSNGATYSVVPFVNRKCLGSISGIVGAGGNMGAVGLGFLFQGEMAWTSALSICGVMVIVAAAAALAIRFAEEPAVAATSTVAEAIRSGAPSTEEPSLNPVGVN
jgi:NNP family nitrate/nitrite transporter-like MFS transporter